MDEQKGIELVSLMINADAVNVPAHQGSLAPAMMYSLLVAIGALSMGYVCFGTY